MDDLIEALTILRKYDNPPYPTNCDHDRLVVAVSPGGVSGDDLMKLKELGFSPDSDGDMRTIYQSSYEKTHADVFEDRISEIKFQAFQRGNLDAWTLQVLSMFSEVELEMGDLCVKESPTHPAPPSRIFRINDTEGLFWYVDVLPITKQFMFIADEKHTTAISPDEGIARLLHYQTGLDTRSVVSDKARTITVQAGDATVTTIDTRTYEDRKKAADQELKKWEK